MKFFLDANIPYSSINIFKKFKHEVQHTREVGMGNSPDKEIIDYAVKNDQILVTKDLHFGNILLYPSKSHKGVIVLRVPFYFTADQINNVLENFLKSTGEKEIKNSLVVVDMNKYQVRKS